MLSEYSSALFPIECMKAHVRLEDLRSFKSIDRDRINAASHLAQLRHGPRTVGLSSLQIYPKYEEIHLTYIEVCSDVRGQQLGKKLLTAVFDHAAEMALSQDTRIAVTVGGFTQKGMRSILPAMRHLEREYSSKKVDFDCPAQYC